MREFICKVSGQRAEATKPNTIRILNVRNNRPSMGEGLQLSDRRDGRSDLLESQRGFPRPFDYEDGNFGSVSPEVGEGNRQASTSDGRDSRLTFPLRVKAAVALGSAAFVAAVWLLPMLIVKLAGAISHLSGVNWLIIGGSTYLLLSIFFFSLVRVAGISDRRAAEMGDRR